MKKKILVIYYSQSGQLKKIIDSVLSPFEENNFEIHYELIRPVSAFPFPWTSDQFFDAFPESFSGIPCTLNPLNTNVKAQFDLVIFGYSPWFLSPSIPVHSFLQSQEAKAILKGKKIITVIGCRNMWLQAQEKIKKYFSEIGADLTGNIALYDKAPNLTSVITIIRWLFKGKQEKTFFFPRAGVSENDIKNAVSFGNVIYDAFNKNDFLNLQENLIQANAVCIKPNLILFEKNGSQIFNWWSAKILKKGPHGDIRRRKLTRLFQYYLLTVIFVISPVADIFYFFIKPFIKLKIRKEIEYFSHVGFANNK